MTPLNIEFAPPRRISPWLWAVLIGLPAMVGAQQGLQAWQAQTRLRLAERDIAALTQQLAENDIARRDAMLGTERPAYEADAQEIAKMAAFPVDQVLTAVESARVQGVRLVGLDLSAVEGTARAELEFSTHEALMQYIEEINAGESAPRWTLNQIQSAQGAGAGSAATLTSRWPATLR